MSTTSPGGDRSVDPSTDVAVDDAFEVLADSTRRAVCRSLRRADGRVGLDELVDSVLDAERETDAEADGDDGRDRRSELRVALVHCHLPKLDGAGVVAYSAADRTVGYRDDPLIESLLRTVDAA